MYQILHTSKAVSHLKHSQPLFYMYQILHTSKACIHTSIFY